MAQAAAINSRLTKGRLTQAEIFWRTLQPWLLVQGYELRKRYRQDWIPSWLKLDSSPDRYEDGQILPYGQIIDAVKVSDGSRVVLKRIKKSLHPNEKDILQYFGTGSLASDSRNHCVPVLDTLYPPSDRGWVIVVMPLLRDYDSPRFDTVGEVVECFRQLFEGLEFMHQHRVAHRDICVQNLMIDARDLCPKGYHFVRKNRALDTKGRARYYTRTQKPAKYYIIGYELARSCKPEDKENLEPPVYSETSRASYFEPDSEDTPDPFATDVYYIGNMIRYYFLDGHTSPRRTRRRTGKLEFIRPLINRMVQEDYTRRPTMSQVVRHFDDLVKDLSWIKLRSRFSRPQDNVFAAISNSIPHWIRKISFIVRRVPAIPTPRVVVQMKDKGAITEIVKVAALPSSIPSKPLVR